jgi:glucosamine--fructose-6-phosphate aminotransferase (isomerizing)
MLAEIAQQPTALERTIKRESVRIAKFAQTLRSRDLRLIILVARGSSDNAAMFGRYLLELTTGLRFRCPRRPFTLCIVRDSTFAMLW